MTNANAKPTPIDIFTDLLDGYSAERVADQISHTDRAVGVKMAEDAIAAMCAKEPTNEQQAHVHEVLDYAFGGDSVSDLVSDHGIDEDDAEIYLAIIRSEYKA